MQKLMCVLILLCCFPVTAEQVTIRNRIFKGPVSGSGEQLLVGLSELAEALGAKLEQRDGRWLVCRPPGPPAAPAGDATVWVEGKAVDSSGDPLMVNLQQFAAAYGLQLRASGDTLEVAVLPRGVKPGASEGPDLIVNGLFTDGPPVGEVALPAGSKSVTGWTVLSAGPWRGSDRGNYYIHITGLAALAQEVYTTPGRDYVVYFAFYGKSKPGNDLEVSAGNQKGVTSANGREQTGTFRFRATDPKTMLRFKSLFPGKGQHAVSLFSVRVSEVSPAP